VLSAVSFNNQAPFEARKIHDPRPNRHLPPKFRINKPTAAKQPPQRLLSERRLSPQGFGKGPLLI